MNDADDFDSENCRIDNVSLYMETLKARMDSEQYNVLARAVDETVHLIAEGHQACPVGDASQFTGEVPSTRRSWRSSCPAAWTTDSWKCPAPTAAPASRSWKPLRPDDPAELQELREKYRRLVTEQQALYNELDGIARASGLSADH